MLGATLEIVENNTRHRRPTTAGLSRQPPGGAIVWCCEVAIQRASSHRPNRAITPAGLPSPRIKARETRAVSQPASRDRLPIGVQTFSEIRRENLYYVDKTHFACQLLRRGKHYFLSRPRRFGKSLFVSTLKALFEGNRELFQGLAADDQWDWSVVRPVAHLSFTSGHYTKPDGLHNNLLKQLRSLARRTDVKLKAVEGSDRFAELLEELHYLSGRRVAVLVDEYDKPITENLNEPDLARANRAYLRAL